MELLQVLASPVMFAAILLTLIAGIGYALVVAARQSVAQRREATQSESKRLTEWEKAQAEREERYAVTIAELERNVAGKDAELKKRMIMLDEELKVNELLRNNVKRLESLLTERDELLTRSSRAVDELEKTVKTLQDKLLKLTTELSLQNQMNEGLRGQYGELEKEYDRLSRVKEQLDKLN